MGVGLHRVTIFEAEKFASKDDRSRKTTSPATKAYVRGQPREDRQQGGIADTVALISLMQESVGRKRIVQCAVGSRRCGVVVTKTASGA
jgi:hypothetical protein